MWSKRRKREQAKQQMESIPVTVPIVAGNAKMPNAYGNNVTWPATAAQSVTVKPTSSSISGNSNSSLTSATSATLTTIPSQSQTSSKTQSGAAQVVAIGLTAPSSGND